MFEGVVSSSLSRPTGRTSQWRWSLLRLASLMVDSSLHTGLALTVTGWLIQRNDVINVRVVGKVMKPRVENGALNQRSHFNLPTFLLPRARIQQNGGQERPHHDVPHDTAVLSQLRPQPERPRLRRFMLVGFKLLAERTSWLASTENCLLIVGIV